MTQSVTMTMDAWLEFGYRNGYCTPPVCYTHDGLPTSVFEDTEFEEGDPCVYVIRLFEDKDEKRAVEANHTPSVWRAINLDWRDE